MVGAENLSFKPPAGTTAHKDLAYAGTDHPRQKLDLFIPPGAKTPVPVVLWIHGGGWLRGDRTQTRVPFLLKHGFALAIIDYRYLTDAPFPAQVQDVNASLNWLHAHAEEYGLNRDLFVVGGSSAGAHLAVLASAARDEKSFGPDRRVRVRAILNYFGTMDLLTHWAYSPPENDAREGSISRLLGSQVAVRPDLARYASPVAYVGANTPPCLIVHGNKDAGADVSQSRLLQSHLKIAGVRADLLLVPGAGHGGPLYQESPVEQKVVSFLHELLTTK